MSSGGPGSRLIDGRFALLERLGGGGMGLVWRARDNALDREVALKEVRPPDLAMVPADSPEARQMRERVLREARALARLQHPNVVIIHHIVDTPEYFYPWLVMELVSGGSLADHLANGPLDAARAARIGRGVLGALRAAHAAGVQHRDVKPGNVLLRADGTPVLTDFGIAALHGATALTQTGALIGSPEYIAPERIRGQEGNPASDLWSLGMLLYVAVEGDHPLRRSSTLATLAAVLDEPLPPPVRAGRLAPVLGALLARDPAARPDPDQLDRMLAAAEHEAGAGPYAGAGPDGSGIPGPAFTATRNLGVRDSGVPADTPPPATAAGEHVTRPAPPTRGRRTLVTVLSTAVVVLVGALAWTLIPGFGDHANSAAGVTPAKSTGAQAGATTAAHTATPAPATAYGDLLTPAGLRATVRAIGPYTVDSKVKELVVYPGYAVADAPTPADRKLYDEVEYRGGQVSHAPGGTMKPDDETVDLRDYDWSVLPALLQKAQKTLNVPHPTSRYVIIGADILEGTPTISVYLSDSYGSGYLSADVHGKVQRTYPRGS